MISKVRKLRIPKLVRRLLPELRLLMEVKGVVGVVVEKPEVVVIVKLPEELREVELSIATEVTMQNMLITRIQSIITARISGRSRVGRATTRMNCCQRMTVILMVFTSRMK